MGWNPPFPSPAVGCRPASPAWVLAAPLPSLPMGGIPACIHLPAPRTLGMPGAPSRRDPSGQDELWTAQLLARARQLSGVGEQLIHGLTRIVLIPRIMHISPSVVAFQPEFCLLFPSNVQLLIPNEVCDCLRHRSPSASLAPLGLALLTFLLPPGSSFLPPLI